MLGIIKKFVLKLLGGSRDERIVRSRMEFVRERINPLEEHVRKLTDEQMRAKTAELKRRLAGGESRDDILPEAFALVREATWRGLQIRHFDVQLVAGMVLDQGWIAEEATGEGKTYSCYPAVYMAVLEGMKVHVVTTNEALVQRDWDFARQVFDLLNVSVGHVLHGMSTAERKPQYACDVTYGTNDQFGFDYLRDNVHVSLEDQAQRSRDFAIIDEVDNILIDEARTPLILSGPSYGETEQFSKADAVAREIISRNRSWDRANQRVESLQRQIRALRGELSKAKGDDAADIEKRLAKAEDDLAAGEEELAGRTKHYEIEMDRKSAHLTHEGVTAAQEIAGVGSFYVGSNMEWPHLMDQALRAHLVYERDKDYVVQNGNVIIVDEFTGRLLEGRRLADGLHQAVEGKERVPIKRENQTQATITYQNFFRLYKKLAGMTGTAMTEADEFMKIFSLDATSVPTHRPVNRADYQDRIYGDIEAKYDAIVEEINDVSKSGRPVLVGTTSIEKSEKISELLQHRYGVEHQVLNGRLENAIREADIVAQAGQQHPLKKDSKQMVGMVTIATNMAGRGTDIKLGPGVVWKNCEVPSAEKLKELGLEVDPLFPSGVNKCCIHCPQYDPGTDCAHCFKPKIDPEFPLRGRTDCPADVPCGLHIVGTERHEARRIDNQLRGRSGRQGDPGSSRFFLSLRDDLMAIFAGEWTLKVLGWLGLQGDAAIEDRRISKGIERAQRKVEERNFEIRKNLLENDEVMDHQRRNLYASRQKILEGRDLDGLVMDMLGKTVSRAVRSYLSADYTRRCITKWARQNLHIPIEEDQIRDASMDDLADLEADLRNRAKDEVVSVISITLGEYMGDDLDPREWDLRGLSSWAMSRFSVNLSQNQLRKMSPAEVESALSEAAVERVDQVDMTGLAKYLQPTFPKESLAEWALSKFPIELDTEAIPEDPDQAEEALFSEVQEAYRRREIEYPVEYAMDVTFGQGLAENVYALGQLAEWANRKYAAGLSAESLREKKPEQIHQELLSSSHQWADDKRLREEIHAQLGDRPDVEPAIEFARTRFDTELRPEDFDSDVVDKLISVGRRFLRREVTELERFVLLQTYDQGWIDHLLAMDHLRSGIGLRSYAEQDPRVALKREGARLFDEMLVGVEEKVADMIFKVRLTAGARMRSVYQVSSAIHERLAGYDHFASEAAEQAQAAGGPTRIKTITRGVPRVGRNDPCPCGSGKKYKKCCGRDT